MLSRILCPYISGRLPKGGEVCLIIYDNIMRTIDLHIQADQHGL